MEHFRTCITADHFSILSANFTFIFTLWFLFIIIILLLVIFVFILLGLDVRILGLKNNYNLEFSFLSLSQVRARWMGNRFWRLYYFRWSASAWTLLPWTLSLLFLLVSIVTLFSQSMSFFLFLKFFFFLLLLKEVFHFLFDISIDIIFQNCSANPKTLIIDALL